MRCKTLEIADIVCLVVARFDGGADLSGAVLGAAADLFLAKRFRRSVCGSCARPLSSCAVME